MKCTQNDGKKPINISNRNKVTTDKSTVAE